MKITYDPTSHYRRYYRSSHNLKPVDIEVSFIIDHAIGLRYEIEVTKVAADIVEILFTEANHHTATVQIFSKTLATCSCEQYCKHQCGCCKHIGVLDYFESAKNGFIAPHEKDFARFVRKSVLSLRPSKLYVHQVYDSLEDNIVSIGSGFEESESLSLATHKKNPRYLADQNRVEVVLPEPYELSREISLYDYQRDILQKMLAAKLAICSMIMGSGKTLLSIAGIKYLCTENILIVCPKSILVQWKNEIKRAIGLDSIEIASKNAQSFVDAEKRQIGICTYQTFSRNSDVLSKIKYDLIIADEIQYVRNNETKTWTAFKKFKFDYFWGLSGTVIENRLDDLYNIMEIIAPGLLGVKWKFDFRFKKLKSIHRAKVLYENELQNKTELQELISKNVFSYDKLNLSPPNVIKTFVNMDNEAQDAHDSYSFQASMLVSKSLSTPLTLGERMILQSLFLRARQCCNSLELIDKKVRTSAKLSEILRIINEVCVQKKEKIVLYSEWTTMLDIIEREIGPDIKTVRLDGSMSAQQRLSAINTFKSDPNCMIFFSSDAGGIGIDGLQLVCNNMIHAELPWNPAKLDQRIGRLNRLLQTKTVNVYYIVTAGSIEAKIDSTLALKRKVRTEALFETSQN